MNCCQVYKKDHYNNEDWDIALCSWSAVATGFFLKIELATKTGQAMALLAWPVPTALHISHKAAKCIS